MRFCIALVSYWNSIGFDTTNWRKTNDGLRAVAHYEYIKMLHPNADSDLNIQIFFAGGADLDKVLTENQWMVNPISLEDLKKQKMARINEICNTEILKGFDSSAKGGILKHYDFTYEDQINMSGIQGRILKEIFLQGAVTSPIEWKNSSQIECEVWAVEEFIQLLNEAEYLKTERIKKNNTLKVMIINATTETEVNNISWDMVI